MKDLQYITHDLGARNDPKLLRLQMEMGGQGLAIWWCLVEMLWENDGRLPLDPRPIAFSLRWATPEEVGRVINDFGLFENDGTDFWSRSALERIAQKKERLSVRENSARNAANVRWGRAGNAPAMPAQCERITDAMPIKKDINIDRNKERDNSSNTAPLTAADLYEIFFFENVKDPAGEAQRFVEYYGGRGWTYLDGTPVTDTERAARDWKPKLPGKRFNDEALRWYRAVWNAYRNTVCGKEAAQRTMLRNLEALRLQGQQLVISFKSAEAGKEVARFILENDLAGDWKLDFRVAN